MRKALLENLPAVVAFVVLSLVAAAAAAAIGFPTGSTVLFEPFAAPAVALPGDGNDQDFDTYADGDDLFVGDALVRFNFTHLRVPAKGGVAEPYIMLGTQDDQWRTGRGRELEWFHIVDHDADWTKPGSAKWQADAIRTGVWVRSAAGLPGANAIASQDSLAPGGNHSGRWPQSMWLNVRDDAPELTFQVEVWDAAHRPHELVARWNLAWRTNNDTWNHPRDGNGVSLDAASGAHLRFSADLVIGPSPTEVAALARRWAPTLHFSAGEQLFPSGGELLQQFHGFSRGPPDLRTWGTSFDNGRDQYRLLLADFNGDRRTDYEDVVVMMDVLRAGSQAGPMVYAYATPTTGDQWVLQFWFIYSYNFVLDGTGRPIEKLAHVGDREFVQLVFANRTAMEAGWPTAVDYSQHYRGIRVSEPAPTSPLFAPGGTGIQVYVARGSHASYPVAGDDDSFRPSFVGYRDEFDGRGEVWTPGNYTLEPLATQEWHAGYLWGPLTRHARDMGTAARPLLQHAFVYPFTDPINWAEQRLKDLEQEELFELYKTPEEQR